MGDETRRKAQRAADQGEGEAQAELLVARLRAGELSRERIRLAALLGSEPARAALDPAEVIALPAKPESADWARAYASLGQDVAARAALALGRALYECYDLIDDPTEKRLELLESWLKKPTKPKAKRLGRDFEREQAEDERWAEVYQFPLREVARRVATIASATDEAALLEVMQSVVEGMEPIFANRTIMERPEELWQTVAAELEDWALALPGETIESWEARQRERAAAALVRVRALDYVTDVLATAAGAGAVLAWAEQAERGDLTGRAFHDLRGELAKALVGGSRHKKLYASRYAAREAKAAFTKLGETTDKETRETLLAEVLAWAHMARGGSDAEVWRRLEAGVEAYRKTLAAGQTSSPVSFDPDRLRRFKRKKPST